MKQTIEIVTPCNTIGWIDTDFFCKSISLGDKILKDALNNMIGFRCKEDNSSYFVGERTDDNKLMYCYNGAYETRPIESSAKILYSKEELLDLLKNYTE